MCVFYLIRFRISLHVFEKNIYPTLKALPAVILDIAFNENVSFSCRVRWGNNRPKIPIIILKVNNTV